MSTSQAESRTAETVASLFMIGLAVFLYFKESPRLFKEVNERSRLLRLRNEGVTTQGEFMLKQDTVRNAYGREVYAGKLRVAYQVGAQEYTTTIDNQGRADQIYYVRYLPSQPTDAYCWQGSESFAAIDSQRSSCLSMIILLSSVILVPGILGSLGLVILLLVKVRQGLAAREE